LPSFKLRPGKDDDLIKALAGVDRKVDKSNVYRAALRLFFFGPHEALRDVVLNHGLNIHNTVNIVDNNKGGIKIRSEGVRIVMQEKKPTST
jgi:hypothetical protein